MNYRLEDIIDIHLLQDLQDKLNRIYSFPSAIIDNEGNVLTAVAWQDVCTKFHRTHPECEKECIKSDKYILEHLHEANPAVSYLCPHGLIDNATPIVINGVHLANFFTGQFFLEKPDMQFFREQAKKYGFDQSAYLKAVERVPVWTKEKLAQYIDFIKGFIEIIAGMGLKNLKEIEINKALHDSEKQFEVAFNSNPIPLSIVSLEDGRIKAANKAYCDFFGYSHETLITSSTLKLGIWVRIEDRARALEEISSTGKLSLFETEVRLASNEIKIVLNSAEKIEWRGQQCFINSNIDITDRKIVERLLHESKEKAEDTAQRLQLALFSGQFGIWDWDVKNNKMLWDDRMYELYGISKDNSPNTIDIWTNGLFADDKQNAIDECNAALRGEKKFNTSFRVKHPDGKILYLRADGVVLRNDEGKPIRMLGINKDVTSEEFTKSELLKAKNKAEESDRLKTAFLRNISHEVRTPLNAIVGFSSIIARRNYADQKLQDFARMISASSEKLIGIMTDVIEISQIQASQLVVNLTEIKLKSFLTRVLAPFNDNVKNTDVKLSIQKQNIGDETAIISDELKIQKIIFHLLDNAFKFTHEGSINLNVVLLNESLRIFLSDTGIGMGEEHQKYVFEPFRQVETDMHRAYGGLGIGLALVKSYVQSLDGNLSFKSETGKGTEVIIELPVMGVTHQSLSNREQEIIVSHVRKAEAKPVILVAEDDPNSFLFIKEVLEAENFTVLHACNGQIAVDICRSDSKINLTLMDFKMPVMDGVAAAKQIKMIRPELPIFAQTAYTDTINGKLECFDEYLTKPVRIDILKSLVFQYLK